MKTIAEQIKAAERELALRRSCYPRWIASGRITKEIAAHETECFLSIVATLEATAEGQAEKMCRYTGLIDGEYAEKELH